MFRTLLVTIALTTLISAFAYKFLDAEPVLLNSTETGGGDSLEGLGSSEPLPSDKYNPQLTPPKLFGDFNIIDAETIEIDFNADTLSVEPTLIYRDPVSGDLLESASIRIISNAVSETLFSSVEINKIKRPLTITIADDTVFMTLPYTGGVLTGEGSRSAITLRKQKPMQDFVNDEGIQAKISHEEPLQEIPVCLNC